MKEPCASRMGSIGRPRRKKRRLLRLLVLLCLLLIPLFALQRQVGHYVTAVCRGDTALVFASALNSAMAKELQTDTLDYSQLIHLTFDPAGNVVSLSADMPSLLSLRTAICRDIYADFINQTPLQVQVPIGALTGIDLLASRGATLQVRVTPARSFRAYFTSEFYEAGINQTLHRIVFCAEADYTLLLPSGQKQFTVKETYCVAETVLLGAVPDAYTKINRLTDELTETDIDDIYDFGAQPN